MERKHSNKLWWLNAPNSPKRSTWLQSTIKELDEKTVSMMKIIEEDGDTFAQRVDIYYMKRPQLMYMVQDMYRSHRSLAEKFYAAKLDSHTLWHTKEIGWPMECFKSKQNKSSTATSFTDTNEEVSLSLDIVSDEFYDESGVDDPELEEVIDMEILNEVSSESQEMMKLKEEIEKLRRENQMQQGELMRKDEEKREVIRQLSLAVEMVKEENQELRKSLAAKDVTAKTKRWNIPELRNVFFSGI